MDLNFTQFAKYSEIEVTEIDLYEDAWGLNTEFGDVIKFLDQLDINELRNSPDLRMFNDL